MSGFLKGDFDWFSSANLICRAPCPKVNLCSGAVCDSSAAHTTVSRVEFPLRAPSFLSWCSVLSCSVIILCWRLWRVMMKRWNYREICWEGLFSACSPAENVGSAWEMRRNNLAPLAGGAWREWKTRSSCGSTGFCVGAKEMLICLFLKNVSWDNSVIMDQQRTGLRTASTVHPSTGVRKLFNIFWYQDDKESSTGFSTSCSASAHTIMKECKFNLVINGALVFAWISQQ